MERVLPAGAEETSVSEVERQKTVRKAEEEGKGSNYMSKGREMHQVKGPRVTGGRISIRCMIKITGGGYRVGRFRRQTRFRMRVK